MPLDTILLLDTSGSMAGRGITELKRACKTFLDGVEETARQTGLRENVAIVEFNTSAKIVQSLSTNYASCRRAIDSLNAGGTTAMLDGLLESLKEILQNGGIVRMRGLALTPRIILMTDGEPTDSAGAQEGKKKVVAAALGFGPGWRQLGLPHPVPIACVGCGTCDSELLEAIAKITKGMFVIVENVAELSTFFRRQVLLIRFATQFASDMERLHSQLALAAFLQELGEAVEEAELEAMMTLLLAMMVSGGGGPRPVAGPVPPPGVRPVPPPGIRAIGPPNPSSPLRPAIFLPPSSQPPSSSTGSSTSRPSATSTTTTSASRPAATTTTTTSAATASSSGRTTSGSPPSSRTILVRVPPPRRRDDSCVIQ